MANLAVWTEILTSIPVEAKQDLENFLNFSELKTGAPETAEERLLETLSLSIARKKALN